MEKKAEGKLRKVPINLDTAIRLDDEGYAELMSRIEEEVQGGLEADEVCEVSSVVLEVRTSDANATDESQNAE